MLDAKSLFVFISFVISLVLGWIIIPNIVLISKRKRLFDKIDDRKEARSPIPRLGGLAFFPVSMFSFAFMLGMRYLYDYENPTNLEGDLLMTFMFVMAGLVMVFFVGLADDLVEVSYRIKFLAQIFCASMLTLAGLYIDSFQGLFGIHEIPDFIGIAFTIGFTVFTINAFNLIDGVNGLCSGMSIVALVILGSWFLYIENFVYSMFAFSMVGVVLAFFYYNIKGRRLQIFMGDTGSLTLGFIIIFLALKFVDAPNMDTTIIGDYYHPINTISLLAGLLFIPLFDTFRVFIERIRKGLAPFSPDRTHIHHKLLDMGYTHIQSTLILISAQILIFLLNVVMSQVLEFNNNITIGADIALALGILYAINHKIKNNTSKPDKKRKINRKTE